MSPWCVWFHLRKEGNKDSFIKIELVAFFSVLSSSESSTIQFKEEFKVLKARRRKKKLNFQDDKISRRLDFLFLVF